MKLATRKLCNWLLPTSCMICGRTLHTSLSLCQDCHRQLPWIGAHCHGCGLHFAGVALHNNRCGKCLSHPSELDGCHALFHYASPLDKLIPAFKYQERLDIGHCLASLLATEVACWYREHPHPDLIVPVPMHYRRYLRRGFNQSWELCKVIGNTTSLRCSEFSLRKVRHTAAQSDLASARARASNLQNAFEVTRKSALQNVKSVTIIDDVVTTMSTVSTLARLLKGHGIQRVEAWCVARAGIGQNQA